MNRVIVTCLYHRGALLHVHPARFSCSLLRLTESGKGKEVEGGGRPERDTETTICMFRCPSGSSIPPALITDTDQSNRTSNVFT